MTRWFLAPLAAAAIAQWAQPAAARDHMWIVSSTTSEPFTRAVAERAAKAAGAPAPVVENTGTTLGLAYLCAGSGADHPDAATIRRLFPPSLFGAMVSFEVKEGGRDEVFRFIDALKLIVRATSLGDVHSMVLYPAMSSHRDLAPKHRQRLGIGDNLVRLSVGIEAVEDIQADLGQALG